MGLFCAFGLLTVWLGVVEGFCPRGCYCLDTTVDCSKGDLYSVPADVPVFVEFLDLSGNHLQNLSSDSFVSQLPALRKLDLSRNQMDFLDGDAFINTPNLVTLSLNQNLLTELPRLSRLRKLEELNARNNNIRSVAAQLFTQSPSLRSVDLSRNDITSFPEITTSLNLTSLVLNHNRIQKLGEGNFRGFERLEYLKLSKNKLKVLHKNALDRLKSLVHLDLSRNRLRTVDGLTFIDLKELKYLSLSGNQLRTMADGSLWGLGNMRELHLEHNNISVITKGWLYGLTALKSLILSNNKIVEIRNGSWEFCANLLELDLSGNQLASLESFTFNGLLSLKTLLLGTNKLAAISNWTFASLQNLNCLELNNNRLAAVMEDSFKPFSALGLLSNLSLKANGIQTIRKTAFVGLKMLSTLHLEDNKVTLLETNAFAELPNLQELYFNTTWLLCDCHLSWFKDWLRSIANRIGGIQDARCGHPDHLKGLSILEISAVNFTCSDLLQPLIITQPESQTALVGSNVSLSCIATSTSTGIINVHWRKDNELIKQSDDRIESTVFERTLPRLNSRETQAELKIIGLVASDAGVYHCVISNDVSTAYSHRAVVVVHVFPQFLKTPQDLSLNVGGTARLECSATGYPPPQISWQKDGGGDDFPAARERRIHVMPTDDVFFIVNVKVVDTGLYTCAAHNQAGVTKANATLTIIEAPQFSKPMRDKSAEAGKTTILECLVSGSPKPQIRWYFNGEPLVRSDRVFLTAENQLLVFVRTVLTDAGTYACEITSHQTPQRQIAQLTVSTTGGKVTEIGTSKPDKVDPPTTGLTFDPLNTAAIIVIGVVGSIVLVVFLWVMIIWRNRRNAALTQRRKELTCIVSGDHLYMPIDSKPPLSPVHYGDHRASRVQTFIKGKRHGQEPHSRHSLSPRLFTGEIVEDVASPSHIRWVEPRSNSFSEYNCPLLGDTAEIPFVLPRISPVLRGKVPTAPPAEDSVGYPSDNHNSISSYASSGGQCGTHSTRLSSRSSMSLQMGRSPNASSTRTFTKPPRDAQVLRRSYSCEDVRK